MYMLVRELSVQRLLAEQLPALVISLLLAETFYKFHSFTLECIAFLITWFVVDALISAARSAWAKFNTDRKGGTYHEQEKDT